MENMHALQSFNNMTLLYHPLVLADVERAIVSIVWHNLLGDVQIAATQNMTWPIGVNQRVKCA